MQTSALSSSGHDAVPIIAVHHLSKHFRIHWHHSGAWRGVRDMFTPKSRLIRAVDDISFKIHPGELVGYIGPNGAGKSTTIKMLTGLLVPSSGEVKVNGYIPWRERRTYVSHIGAVFGQRTTLWWDLPVIESFDLLQYIYRIPKESYNRNLAEFRELLNLDEFLDIPVRSLSLGQRMRADICAALLHSPQLVFLDEPTIGLDVVAKERIRRFIQHINRERGTTVILTTHDLADVEKLCERVMIIDHGKVLFDGPFAALRARFGGKRELVVDFAEFYDDVSVPGIEIVRREDGRVTYQFEPGVCSASDLISRLSEHFHIRDLTVREPDIETTVRRIYEERLLEPESPSFV